MTTVAAEVVRQDDTGRVVADFAVLPVVGDEIVLDRPERNLEGTFRVTRRLLGAGLGRPRRPILVVLPRVPEVEDDAAAAGGEQ